MWDMTKTVRQLESAATASSRDAGVDPDIWARFLELLEPLKHHNLEMYAHSLRVGLYAYGVARNEGQTDLRLPLMGGCGHDVGKCKVPNSILNCPDRLTDQQFRMIYNHPQDGFDILKGEFPLSAMVAGLHHSFTKRSYGMRMADLPPWMIEGHVSRVLYATAIVTMCDFYDAITTRRNASTTVDPDDIWATTQYLCKQFPESPNRTSWLVNNRI